MAYVTTGLSNSGRTQFFNVQYDDALSTARGLGLATELMQHCDADLALLSSWFSGRQLDMSPPINLSVNTVAVDAAGSPTQFVGGHWGPSGGPFPLQMSIDIGEFPMFSGTAPMLARYLLIAEVSEMFMRAFNAHGPNPWFRFGEGNKGEGLSRFLGAKFLIQAFPGIGALPSLDIAAWNVTNIWLDSERKPTDLDVDDEDNRPDAVTGCATLFLFYLSDQLGFGIADIINAGAGVFSNVYQNLTHDGSANAWASFGGIVNTHFPHTKDSSGSFAPRYSPPLETVFPVSELTLFTAPALVTWAPPGTPSTVNVGVNPPAVMPVSIAIGSSNPAVIPAFSATILPPTGSSVTSLVVLPQPAGFHTTSVLLTASYAGRSLTRTVVVAGPDAMSLPALEIDADRSADWCQPFLVEATSQTFIIRDLGAFANQSGLSYSWSITGAVPGATDASTLTIPVLPAAGSMVNIGVTVTNAQNLRASGSLSFQTVAAATGLAGLQDELRCRLSQFRNANLNIPPWVPIELGTEGREQLILIERQLHEVTQLATRAITLTRSMTKIAKRSPDEQN